MKYIELEVGGWDMVIRLIIALLIVGHVLGDFYFQSEELVKDKLSNDKDTSHKALFTHSLHHFGISVLIMFLLFGVKLLFPIIILGISHYGIDWIKVKLQKKFDKDSIRIFVLDQFLHLLMIFFMIPIIKPIDETSFIFWHKWISAWLVELFPVLNKINNNHWTVVVATIGLYLSIINGGTVVTKLLINKIKESPAENQQNTNEPALGEVAATQGDGQQQSEETVGSHHESQSEKTYTGGEIIGNLERVLILTLILLKEYAVISFVLAAKSIARYNKIVEDPNFSDKFLIGTLTSVMIAIVAGIIFRWVIII